MVFIIPIILGAAAAATTVTGVVKGVGGHSKKQEAKNIIEALQQRYQRLQTKVEQNFESTKKSAENYKKLRKEVEDTVVDRFASLIERLGQNAFLR